MKSFDLWFIFIQVAAYYILRFIFYAPIHELLPWYTQVAVVCSYTIAALIMYATLLAPDVFLTFSTSVTAFLAICPIVYLGHQKLTLVLVTEPVYSTVVLQIGYFASSTVDDVCSNLLSSILLLMSHSLISLLIWPGRKLFIKGTVYVSLHRQQGSMSKNNSIAPDDGDGGGNANRNSRDNVPVTSSLYIEHALIATMHVSGHHF